MCNDRMAKLWGFGNDAFTRQVLWEDRREQAGTHTQAGDLIHRAPPRCVQQQGKSSSAHILQSFLMCCFFVSSKRTTLVSFVVVVCCCLDSNRVDDLLSDEGLDVLLDVRGRVPPAVTLDRHSVLVDEEFLEVPRNVVPLDRTPDNSLRILHQLLSVASDGKGKLRLQESEHWKLLLSVHVSALEDREVGGKSVTGTDVLKLRNNFVSFVVGLVAELVRGETKTGEAFFSVSSREIIHSSEIAHGRASQSRDVLDEENLSLVGGKVDRGTVEELTGELVNVFGIFWVGHHEH
mmetsp:Transcript_24998/g.44449  ORF Transcript_24998/g.44449 Transcript_24998/m.44449 type:complete len:292 (-) Transcript_24998:216-1091(-)